MLQLRSVGPLSLPVPSVQTFSFVNIKIHISSRKMSESRSIVFGYGVYVCVGMCVFTHIRLLSTCTYEVRSYKSTHHTVS